MAKKPSKCCVFIDNSNLFIEGQKTYAKRHDFLSDRDIRFRIDYWKLMKVLKRKRRCIYSALFGSEPPPIEALWERVREKKIEVFRYNRDDHKSEKELDTDLTAHVTRKAIEMTRSHQDNLTFVIVAGDGDYIPAFKQVMQEKFNLEIYSWKGCISGRIKQFANLKKYQNNVVIHYLDESILENDVCYLAEKWNRDKHEIPPERSIVFKSLIKNKPIDAKSLAKDVTKNIRLPCKYFQPDPDSDTECIRLPCKHSQSDPDSNKPCQYFLPDPDSDTTKCIRFPCKHSQPDPDFDTVIIIVVGDLSRMADESTGSKDGDKSHTEDLLVKKFVPIFNSVRAKFADEITNGEYEITNYPNYWQIVKKILPLSSSNNANTEAYDDEETGKYTMVRRTPRTSPQKYSQRCKRKYACNRGGRCAYSHSNKEKEHFRNHPEHLGGFYKSKKCEAIDAGGCTSKSCVFAHGLNEARCYFCDPGGKVGEHWMDDCSNEPKQEQQTSPNELNSTKSQITARSGCIKTLTTNKQPQLNQQSKKNAGKVCPVGDGMVQQHLAPTMNNLKSSQPPSSFASLFSQPASEPNLVNPGNDFRAAVLTAMHTEFRTMLSRSSNVVVSGLKPASDTSDEQLFKYLCFTYFSLHVDVVKTVRMGKLKVGRIQDLLVTLPGSAEVSKLLSVARIPRQSNDKYVNKNVSINEYLAPVEGRAANRVMRRSKKESVVISNSGSSEQPTDFSLQSTDIWPPLAKNVSGVDLGILPSPSQQVIQPCASSSRA